MSRTNSERRGRPRTAIQKPASMEIWGANEEILGIVTDVSTTGLAILTDVPPEVGAHVTVRATLDGDRHGVQGEVVHVARIDAEHYVVGLRYDLLMLEEDRFLEEALRQSIAAGEITPN